MAHRTADDVLQFFRECLVHVKGPLAGKPFVPDQWQIDDIIKPLFNERLKDGRRRYKTVFVEIPRKNGKSTYAAGMALYLLLADREPGPEVVSAAADREQASIVFDIARSMVEASDVLRPLCRIYRKEIVVEKTGGRYRALSADAYTKHGMNLSGIIFDEVHAQPNRELWDVLTTSTGARLQPLNFAITTAGHDRDSLCWGLHDYACKVRDGVISDASFLPVIYAADPAADWTDEATWRKANPGYGVSITKDYFKRSCAEAQATPAREQAFRRLHLCQWTESVTRWIGLDRWDACRADLPPLAGRECYAGLDLASTTDLAALCLAFPLDDGTFAVRPYFWAPEEAAKKRERENRPRLDGWARSGHLSLTPGDVLDYDRIRADINRLSEEYDIAKVAIDRWNATQLSTQLMGDGLAVVGFGQGYASMSGPSKELESLVLGRRVLHDGHPVLRWNVANVAVQSDAAGNIKPSKRRSSEKIDGVVAMVMALALATAARKDQPSVYQTRGVDFLEALPARQPAGPPEAWEDEDDGW